MRRYMLNIQRNMENNRNCAGKVPMIVLTMCSIPRICMPKGFASDPFP